MYFASINEAFGVDSLEKKDDTISKRTPVTRVKFPSELVGEPPEDAFEEDVPTMIPEERKLTDLEVKRYISELYTKQGMKKVWALIDPKIRKRIVETCNRSVKNTQKWFEDILSSPEKLLIILGVIFVLILLVDSASAKKTEPVSPPMYRPTEYYYYPQPPQFREPVDIRW